MIDLSIIIVSWNSRRDLRRCLPSIGSGCRTITAEVLLVDNASSDDSVVMAQELFPGIRVIANQENAGFAHANNQAMAVAAGRYVCLLNPDTEVHAGALDTLVAFMDAHVEAWGCGPALLNGDGSPQRTGVRFPSLWNMLVEALFLDRMFPRTRLFGSHRELYEQWNAPREVDFVQGSCLLVSRKAIGEVGGLDEGFFMYFEETDWCRRIAGAGGKIMLVPGAGVIHYGGGAVGHYDERRLVHYHVSLFRYFAKHHGRFSQRTVRLLIVVRSLIRIGVWSAMGLVRPGVRAAAISTMKGYFRVIGIALGRKASA
jgi:GT2 family glycosyltransferase